MKFESGMLGFLIIVLAVGGAIAGTIMLSAEEQTQEVTKYNLVADVTGLFDTDESPQYFDYDLSKNYTGYYTIDTVIDGVNYWGGADFTPTGVNNYPIKYEPRVSDSDTVNLTDYNSELVMSDPPGSGTQDSDCGISYYGRNYGAPGPNTGYIYCRYATIESVIEALDLDGYEMVTFKSPTTTFQNGIFFGNTSQIIDFNNLGAKTVRYVQKDVYESYANLNDYYMACYSCTVNVTTGQVDFFFSNTALNDSYVYSASMSDCFIAYMTIVDPSNENDIVSYTAFDVENIDYMDITRGVTVTGVA